MKSVLFSTDFVRRGDGSLTPLEINTNTGHSIKFKHPSFTTENFNENFDGFMNHTELNEFMLENNLTKIIIIDAQHKFGDIFKIFCEFYNFEYEYIVLERNAVNIPEIEELENELIIRIAYDSYSILDDLYARDMYQFHNLIKDESFASPVTFIESEIFGNDGLDTITEVEYSIDGVTPNYVLKPRFPTYDEREYPKLYRFENEEHLNNIKSGLSKGGFLQKYEINKSYVEENGNTTYYYRSINLVFNESFDILNLFSYKGFNSVRLDNESIRYEYEVDENYQINNALGLKYYPLWYTRNGFQFHFDDTDDILLPDGNLIKSENLKIGDFVKSIKFNKAKFNKAEENTDDLNDFEIIQSEIKHYSENTKDNLFINIKAYSEEFGYFEWYDGWSNPYLTLRKDGVGFTSIKRGGLEVGDTIYAYNNKSSEVVPFVITEIFFDIKPHKTYLISLNDNPLFFIKLDNISDDLFLIQHNNNCDYYCYTGNAYGYSCSLSICAGCSKNSEYCFNCGGNINAFCYG